MFFDVVFGDDDGVVDGSNSQSTVGFFLDQTTDAATIFQNERAHTVVAAHDGAGVDDVFEDVVQVGPVGTSDVGADFAATAKQHVA